MFTETRPAQRPRTITGTVKERVLELRARSHSVTEIARMLTRRLPISARRLADPARNRTAALARRENTRRGTRCAWTRSRRAPGVLAGRHADPCDQPGCCSCCPIITPPARMTAAAGYRRPAPVSLPLHRHLLLPSAGGSPVHHIDALTEDRGWP